MITKYGRILDRMLDDEVSPHIRSLSIRILEWMPCSYRRLKVYEILNGVSICQNCTTFDSNLKLYKRALDLYRPLIEDDPFKTLQATYGRPIERVFENFPYI